MHPSMQPRQREEMADPGPDHDHIPDSGSPTNPHSRDRYADYVNNANFSLSTPTNMNKVADSKFTTQLDDDNASPPLWSSFRFLTLTPENKVAQDMVAESVSILTADPDTYEHHRQFLETVQVQAGSDTDDNDNSDEGDGEQQDANTQASTTLETSTIKSHRFLLSLSQTPSGPNKSWAIGPGSQSKFSPNQGIDILLLPPKPTSVSTLKSQSKPLPLPPVIALIWINRMSGAFMLKAVGDRCVVEYVSGAGADGSIVLECGQQTVLWMRSNVLKFGKGDERSEWAVDVCIGKREKDEFFEKRDVFLSTKPLPTSLDPFPYGSHTRCHDIIKHTGILDTGSFGWVFPGVHATTGEPVAVKIMQIVRKDDIKSVMDEIRIAELLTGRGSHAEEGGEKYGNKRRHGGRAGNRGEMYKSGHEYIVPFLKAWCEHGDCPPCFSHVEQHDQVYCVMPLARCNFQHFFWHPATFPPLPSSPFSSLKRKVVRGDKKEKEKEREEEWGEYVRLRLFRDVLKGLAHIHAHGVMHRDISPKNLLVFSHHDSSSSPPSFSSSTRPPLDPNTGVQEEEEEVDEFPYIARIADFGKSLQASHSTYTRIGPMSIVAPEVWLSYSPTSSSHEKGKGKGNEKGYTDKIDMWSLGYTHLWLLCVWLSQRSAFRTPQIFAGSNKTDEKRNNQLLALIKDLVNGRFIGSEEGHYLKGLLEWDPERRLSAKSALECKVWRALGVGTVGDRRVRTRHGDDGEEQNDTDASAHKEKETAGGVGTHVGYLHTAPRTGVGAGYEDADDIELQDTASPASFLSTQ